MVVVSDENPVNAPEVDGEGSPTAKKRGGGPRTDPGKLRARASAFDHGFRARIVFSDDMAKAIRERKAMLTEQFQPRTEYQHSLIVDMAVARVKLDRVEEVLPANCDRAVERGLSYWDDDQKMLALKLETRLHKDPARFAHVLAGTKQGAALMIERWEALAHIARACGGWDDAQRWLALDLLGVPIELQPGSAALAPPGDVEALVAVATGQIERLRSRIETVLDDQDAQNQSDTIAGILVADDAHTVLLRRYEAGARRDYNRAHAELLRVQAAAVTREPEERERVTHPSGSPEAQPAAAAAPPHSPEQEARREAQRKARIDRVMAATRGADAEASATAEPSATEAGNDAPAGGESRGAGPNDSPNWDFYREGRRSAHRQAGKPGK
jgi:hypothetical protein